jgi:RNA polymerase sigma factor (sigma-70 family)
MADSPAEADGPQHFPETRWSVVLAAQGKQGERALDDLCRAYWYPVYAYLRRIGARPQDAEDLTQGFFAEFLAKRSLDVAAQERGRFRSFLLGSLKNHTVDEWRKTSALKRGGGVAVVSIDQMLAEERLAGEPAHDASPDVLYDQSWAYAVLNRTVERLREYYTGLGKAALFVEIEGCISWDKSERSYAEIAAKLGLKEQTVRFAVHQFRKRYQSVLRQQILDTVATPEDAEGEIAYLCEVLARS